MSDLISRQAVEDAMYDATRSMDLNFGQIMEYIDKIPSAEKTETVTEFADRCRECGARYGKYRKEAKRWKNKWLKSQKSGHWKRISMDKYSEHAKYWFRCDRCGEDNLGNTDWCPNCGAKMESEEISDSNLKMWEEIFKAERSGE